MKKYIYKIITTTILVFFLTNIQAQSVITDKDDYAPGDTALITGEGFLPGEAVRLQVLHHESDSISQDGENHDAWLVIADEIGSFTSTWRVCEDDCVGALLHLTATGQTSGRHAETQFTDALRTDTYPWAFSNFSGGNSYCHNATASSLTAVWSTTSCNGINNGGNTNIPITIRWYRNSLNSTSGGTVVQTTNSNAGTTSSSYLPPTNTVGVLYYYAVVSWSNGANCAIASGITTSATQTVAVNTPISNNTIASSQTICSGATPSVLTGSIPNGGNGDYNYLWERSVSSASAGYSSAVGTNNEQNYSAPTLTQTTWFRRNVSSGGCSSISSAIQISVTPANSQTANAGPDQNICSVSTATLAGNTPTAGTGTWSLISGSGSIASPNSPNTVVNGLGTGSNIFRWIISGSGNCPSSEDEVSINVLNILPAPESVNGAKQVCSGSSVIYSTSVVSGASSYTWTVPSGWSITSGATTTAITVSTGTASGLITAKAVNACGAGAATSISVTSASVIINGSNSICFGGTVALVATECNVPPNGAFQWRRNGLNINGATSQTLIASSSGTYYVVYHNVNFNNPFAFDSPPITLTINPQSIYNNEITASQTICSGATPDPLSGTLPTGGDGNFSYLWERSISSGSAGFSAAPGSNNGQNYNPTSQTQTTWYRRTVSSGGCVNLATLAIVVPVPAAAAGSPSTVCGGSPVNLGAPPVAGSTYSWTSNPSGFTSNSANPTVNPTITTTYSVTETAGPGCSRSNSVLITVNALPLVNAAASSSAICYGSSATLTASGEANNYKWGPGNLNGTLIEITPTVTTTYSVVGTKNYSGGIKCTDSSAVTIVVNPLPVALAGADATICAGNTATLGGSPVAGSEYSWTSNPAGFTSNAAEPVVSPTLNTSYFVEETITATGCSKTNSVHITVYTAPMISCPADSSIHNQVDACGATFEFTATATGIPPPTISYLIVSGSFFSVGITPNISTATNVCGTATCAFNVTVLDVQSPSITCAPIHTQSTDPGICTASVAAVSPTVADNCSFTFSNNFNGSTNASGVYPKGNTMVSWTVTDQGNNQATCQQTIVILDLEAPVLNCASHTTVNCEASTLPSNTGTSSSTDNCDSNPVTTYTDASTQVAGTDQVMHYNYLITRTWSSEDADGNASNCNQNIRVQDTTKPVFTFCPESVYKFKDPYSTTYSITSNDFDATASDNCSPISLSYSLGGITTGTGSSLAGLALTNGTTSVQWIAEDVSGNTNQCYFYINVGDRPTTLTITQPTVNSAQYSDIIQLQAVLNDHEDLLVKDKPIVFVVGTQTTAAVYTNTNGVATTTLRLNQNPRLTYTDNIVASFAGDNTYIASSATKLFDVKPEDACGVFNGDLFANTNSPTGGSATVRLKIYVTETPDGSPGDIREATVTFTVMDGASTFSVVGAILDAANSTSLAAVYYRDITASLSSQVLSKTFDVYWKIGAYYSNANCSENETQVTISAPAPDFVTGGGFVVLSNSAGSYSGTPGSKNNFGFSAKWNKNMSNIQGGGINTIIRKDSRTYQVKGNKVTYLSVVPKSGTVAATAVFYCNAVIMDVTDPYNSTSLEGNASMVVEITDGGEPGVNDAIAITVRDKNGALWYANNWIGGKAVKQLLGGGNIQIRSGSSYAGRVATIDSSATDSIPTALDMNPENGLYIIKIFPNPAERGRIKVSVRGTEPTQKTVELSIYDLSGKLMYSNKLFCREDCKETMLDLDGRYLPGIYLIDLLIEGKIYHQKLVVQ